MATIEYILGESGTLGFAVDQYDGTPMPLDGLSLRLTIYVPGEDVRIIGTATAGEVDMGAGPTIHPSIASFAITPADMPRAANLYRASLDVNDGTGWRVIDTPLINVRRLE